MKRPGGRREPHKIHTCTADAVPPEPYKCIDTGVVGKWSYSIWQRDSDGKRQCWVDEALIDVPLGWSLEKFKQWLASLPAMKERG